MYLNYFEGKAHTNQTYAWAKIKFGSIPPFNTPTQTPPPTPTPHTQTKQPQEQQHQHQTSK